MSRLLLIPAVCLALLTAVRAERLPVREYRSADGLPHDRVERIVRDSRGFLWFCTAEGLGRFDGHGFSRLGTKHGLPNPAVNDLLETRAGPYWVATNGGGLARFEPSSAATSAVEGAALRVTVFDVGDSPASNHVNVLFEDRGGRVWAGTDAGLFVLDATAVGERFEAVGLPGPLRGATQPAVLAFAEDAEGSLWIGTTYGVARRLPEGSLTAQAVSPAEDGTDTVSALLTDESGRLWVGHNSGVLVAKPSGAPPPNGSVAGESWHVVANDHGVFGAPAAATGPNLPSRPGEAVWVTGPAEGPRNATTALLKGSDGRV
jgi:ligand-binding sensor domain-containing protein